MKKLLSALFLVFPSHSLPKKTAKIHFLFPPPPPPPAKPFNAKEISLLITALFSSLASFQKRKRKKKSPF